MAKEAKAAATTVEEEVPASEAAEMFDITIADNATQDQFTARTMASPSLIGGVANVLNANGYTMTVMANRKIDVTAALKVPTAKPMPAAAKKR